MRKSYRSDLTDEQWDLIRDLLPAAKPGALATGAGAGATAEGPKPGAETPAASQVAAEQAGVVEAMRKARQRLRGRTE
jgi:hypothetical protein